MLVIDEEEIFRERIAQALAAVSGVTVVGCCGSAREAVSFLWNQAADIALVDYASALGRTRFLSRARAAGFTGSTVVLAAGIDPSEGIKLVRQGVLAICSKSGSLTSMVETIQLAAQGILSIDERYFRPALNFEIAESPTFSPRQELVIRYLKRGLSNREVADGVGMSLPSVKFVLHELYQITGVETRGQLLYLLLKQQAAEDQAQRYARPALPQIMELADLSPRQRLVTHYLKQGLSNREIAAWIGISLPAVKRVLHQIFQITGVRTRGHLLYLLMKGETDEVRTSAGA